MPHSDSLYHRLFAHPRMVEGLLREFVSPGLITDLDFPRLQRVNSKFHPDRDSAQRREGDVIWRLPIHEGSDIDLYLLIEFQSESDEWMAVRTQVYQGLLWQQVIDEQKLQADMRLPPLLLLVLYNGERRWKAASTTGDLIALSPDSALWSSQPRVRYHLLDMGAFPKDELARRSSLVALLFRLERQHSPDDFKELLDEVIGWFRQRRGYERLQGLFTELIREALARHRVNLPGSGDLLEMKSMLTIDFETWLAKGRAEGKAEGKMEGRAEGKVEGKVEGMAEALICLLAKRFGAVAPSWQKQIHEAGLATLERWFERAIVAPDLTSVFEPPC